MTAAKWAEVLAVAQADLAAWLAAMAVLAGAAYLSVFLRAWQQQNVVHGFYYWAVATSYGLAVADVLIMVGAVRHGLEAAPFIGTGAAGGVLSAMWLRRHLRP